ncbi:MAG: hypothetical protein ACXAC8_17715, partial [Candidatus Hodarchaeales archaeon]
MIKSKKRRKIRRKTGTTIPDPIRQKGKSKDSLNWIDDQSITKGQISKNELKQSGYLIDNRLKDSAPVESIAGIGVVKGKKLRAVGVKTVGDLRRKQKKVIPQSYKKVEEQIRLAQSSSSIPQSKEEYDTYVHKHHKKVESQIKAAKESKSEIKISPDDIDSKIARNAYRNTYFDPEGRGRTAQNDYAIILTNDYKQLKKHAVNSEQKKILDEAMKRYQKDFISKYEDILHSHSRLASTHITGGSKFPVQRQKKLQGWHDNKQKQFKAWRDKVKTSIRRKLKRAITEGEIQADRDKSLSHDIRNIEASYRAVENNKKWDISPQYIRNLEKSKIFDRLSRLAHNGNVDEVNRQLEIIKVRQEKFGKQF